MSIPDHHKADRMSVAFMRGFYEENLKIHATYRDLKPLCGARLHEWREAERQDDTGGDGDGWSQVTCKRCLRIIAARGEGSS